LQAIQLFYGCRVTKSGHLCQIAKHGQVLIGFYWKYSNISISAGPLWLTNAVAAGTNQLYRIVTPLQPQARAKKRFKLHVHLCRPYWMGADAPSPFRVKDCDFFVSPYTVLLC
jgi:hypothetical protein